MSPGTVVSATKPPKDVQLNTDIVVAVHTHEDNVSDDERQHVLGVRALASIEVVVNFIDDLSNVNSLR